MMLGLRLGAIVVGATMVLAACVPGPLAVRVAALVACDVLLLWGMFDRRAPIFGRIPSRMHPRTPAVAITFDDGPVTPYTDQILDVLEHFDAKATFFMLGLRAEAAPEVVRRVAAAGHEIANHGWNHAPLALKGPGHTRSTIAKTSATLARIGGARPRLFRAPYGWRNPWVRASARAAGCTPVAWTLGVHDTDRPGADAIAARAIEGLHDGCILLLHDGRSLDPAPDASQVVDALPRILEAARARGFRMLTLSQLAEEGAW